MKRAIQEILEILMAFLPPRYRAAGARLREQGMVAGILQLLLAIGILVFRFYIFSWKRAAIIGPGVDTPSNLPEVNATFGGGIFMMAEFVLRPLNMILLYFFYEGLIRWAAANFSDQVVGSLPFYVVSGVHGLIDKANYRRYVGPLVPDEILRGKGKGFDLKIYSCRAKLHWNPYMTVEFENQFYQMFKEEYGDLPRRFIYYLRKSPTGFPVVVVDHYTIDNVMKAEPDKFAGAPGFWETAFPDWNLPPLVKDEVIRGTARQDYDLKIYSCRRKQDWTGYVTIEFEDQWYQLVKDERGEKPRPFIYYLRKAAESRPAPVVRRYQKDDVLKDRE